MPPCLTRSLCLLSLVFALALPAAPAVARPRPPRPDTLTVVTLNLWHDQRDWPRRRALILAGLRPLRPDVICLQEVLQHERLPNQAFALAESLGMRAHFTSVDPPGAAKRYGNAILTAHRLLATGGRALRPLDDYRTVAHARLEVRGRVLDVYDTHLHHTEEGGAIRAAQLAHLLAYVDSTRGDGPVVLAGDFNAGLGGPEMAPVRERFVDAWAALHPDASAAESATLNPAYGHRAVAIDHVLVERKDARLAPVAAEVLFRAPGPDSVWASDHFGVLARFAARRDGR